VQKEMRTALEAVLFKLIVLFMLPMTKNFCSENWMFTVELHLPLCWP